MKRRSLTPFIWLSILAAVVTIILKFTSYKITGSVGLLSEAIESIVNFAAAIIALLLLRVAEKPPDDDHSYGHTKAEYFSSVVEGGLILIASLSIAVSAVNRLFHPGPIEQAFIGLSISSIASLINLCVAVVLLRAGKKYRSITLQADGHHLMTDVWTSVGVLVGIALVSITKIQFLDPVIALIVAANILFTGFKLIKESAFGLMDTALPQDELQIVKDILDKYCTNKITYHGLRSRLSGTRKFISVHILVPGSWTVQKGHDLSEEIEIEICKVLPMTNVATHLEPLEDPKSLADIDLDRKD